MKGYGVGRRFKVLGDDGLIEGKGVKVMIVKIVGVCVLGERWIWWDLKEIDGVRYRDEEFDWMDE